MAYEEIKTSGVTEKTKGNLFLGAGTIHKNLTFSGSAWNFANTLVGATSGGNKLTITPEIEQIEIDGVMVDVKGFDMKMSESATLEVNVVEITPDVLKTATLGEEKSATDATGYSMITSKAQITEGDYFDNIAFVGKKTDGTPIIVILENAICTSGLEMDNKHKDKTVVKLTFKCTADPTEGTDKLPWKIYYPTARS